MANLVQDKYRNKKEYMLAHAEMITAARYRGTLTYQEVSKLLGWPLSGQWTGTEIGHLLSEISEDEVAQGRPMLAAIVTTNEGYPGPGFYNLARQLGRMSSTEAEKEVERAFWRKECQKVYDEWKVVLPKK